MLPVSLAVSPVSLVVSPARQAVSLARQAVSLARQAVSLARQAVSLANRIQALIPASRRQYRVRASLRHSPPLAKPSPPWRAEPKRTSLRRQSRFGDNLRARFRVSVAYSSFSRAATTWSGGSHIPPRRTPSHLVFCKSEYWLIQTLLAKSGGAGTPPTKRCQGSKLGSFNSQLTGSFPSLFRLVKKLGVRCSATCAPEAGGPRRR